MEFYSFVRGLLAWTASIACLFPLNVPMLYFAHRIREGRMAEDDENRIDNDELWKRSGLGSLALAAMTIALSFADVVLADWAKLPAGIVHFVILLLYVSAGAYVLAYFFGYEDYFFGLGLLTLYLGLPMLVLFLVNAVVPVWNWMLAFYYRFLMEIK